MRKPKGWTSDTDAHKKAGKKGGDATARKYGKEFYKKIGSIGGKRRR
jgi:general stress protein YciG